MSECRKKTNPWHIQVEISFHMTYVYMCHYKSHRTDVSDQWQSKLGLYRQWIVISWKILTFLCDCVAFIAMWEAALSILLRNLVFQTDTGAEIHLFTHRIVARYLLHMRFLVTGRHRWCQPEMYFEHCKALLCVSRDKNTYFMFLGTLCSKGKRDERGEDLKRKKKKKQTDRPPEIN